MNRGFSVVVLSLAVSLLASGCAHVPAYQRGRLAHRTMLPDFGESAGRAHFQAISEGAAGGEATPASGCGCN
jgi:hypothetical protein